ncbi:MAG: glycosidase, partial [Deltaproteobacteria bacterium]|nr:glycosidase [Deltaproteobacteria bacterium]
MMSIADYLQKQDFLFKRYEENPILTPTEWPYIASAVFNPGAVTYNGETLLLNRVEGFDGLSHLTVARSKNGKTNWKIDPKPTLLPDPAGYPEELWGIEDARIVKLEELNQFAITYTAYSEGGPLVSLALTEDFQKFHRQGLITVPENKDAALFPRRFNDRWVLIHRPTMPKSNIWLSFSPDLKHWGDHSVLMKARDGGYWDANKIGLGPPPIETPEGWLLIYHAVKRTASGVIYRVGLALLDLDNPRKVIRRGGEWVLGPREEYERIGDVPSVTFPSGVVWDIKTDE